ncbi:uncharacterized protein LOC135827403 isoform X2 [Sycon ciliatum]|uniref:uncharacterized protein LOC135827403 isoform X2 n=1 Tax=Sycon ciliatum TaxID=27933 RepID=UPI0031F67FB8
MPWKDLKAEAATSADFSSESVSSDDSVDTEDFSLKDMLRQMSQKDLKTAAATSNEFSSESMSSDDSADIKDSLVKDMLSKLSSSDDSVDTEGFSLKDMLRQMSQKDLKTEAATSIDFSSESMSSDDSVDIKDLSLKDVLSELPQDLREKLAPSGDFSLESMSSDDSADIKDSSLDSVLDEDNTNLDASTMAQIKQLLQRNVMPWKDLKAEAATSADFSSESVSSDDRVDTEGFSLKDMLRQMSQKDLKTEAATSIDFSSESKSSDDSVDIKDLSWKDVLSVLPQDLREKLAPSGDFSLESMSSDDSADIKDLSLDSVLDEDNTNLDASTMAQIKHLLQRNVMPWKDLKAEAATSADFSSESLSSDDTVDTEGFSLKDMLRQMSQKDLKTQAATSIDFSSESKSSDDSVDIKDLSWKDVLSVLPQDLREKLAPSGDFSLESMSSDDSADIKDLSLDSVLDEDNTNLDASTMAQIKQLLQRNVMPWKDLKAEAATSADFSSESVSSDDTVDTEGFSLKDMLRQMSQKDLKTEAATSIDFSSESKSSDDSVDIKDLSWKDVLSELPQDLREKLAPSRDFSLESMSSDDSADIKDSPVDSILDEDNTNLDASTMAQIKQLLQRNVMPWKDLKAEAATSADFSSESVSSDDSVDTEDFSLKDMLRQMSQKDLETAAATSNDFSSESMSSDDSVDIKDVLSELLQYLREKLAPSGDFSLESMSSDDSADIKDSSLDSVLDEDNTNLDASTMAQIKQLLQRNVMPWKDLKAKAATSADFSSESVSSDDSVDTEDFSLKDMLRQMSQKDLKTEAATSIDFSSESKSSDDSVDIKDLSWKDVLSELPQDLREKLAPSGDFSLESMSSDDSADIKDSPVDSILDEDNTNLDASTMAQIKQLLQRNVMPWKDLKAEAATSADFSSESVSSDDTVDTEDFSLKDMLRQMSQKDLKTAAATSNEFSSESMSSDDSVDIKDLSLKDVLSELLQYLREKLAPSGDFSLESMSSDDSADIKDSPVDSVLDEDNTNLDASMMAQIKQLLQSNVMPWKDLKAEAAASADFSSESMASDDSVDTEDLSLTDMLRQLPQKDLMRSFGTSSDSASESMSSDDSVDTEDLSLKDMLRQFSQKDSMRSFGTSSDSASESMSSDDSVDTEDLSLKDMLRQFSQKDSMRSFGTSSDSASESMSSDDSADNYFSMEPHKSVSSDDGAETRAINSAAFPVDSMPADDNTKSDSSTMAMAQISQMLQNNIMSRKGLMDTAATSDGFPSESTSSDDSADGKDFSLDDMLSQLPRKDLMSAFGTSDSFSPESSKSSDDSTDGEAFALDDVLSELPQRNIMPAYMDKSEMLRKLDAFMGENNNTAMGSQEEASPAGSPIPEPQALKTAIATVVDQVVAQLNKTIGAMTANLARVFADLRASLPGQQQTHATDAPSDPVTRLTSMRGLPQYTPEAKTVEKTGGEDTWRLLHFLENLHIGRKSGRLSSPISDQLKKQDTGSDSSTAAAATTTTATISRRTSSQGADPEHLQATTNCSRSLCSNNGKCVVDMSAEYGFFCICNADYTGTQCQSVYRAAAAGTGVSSALSASIIAPVVILSVILVFALGFFIYHRLMHRKINKYSAGYPANSGDHLERLSVVGFATLEGLKHTFPDDDERSAITMVTENGMLTTMPPPGANLHRRPSGMAGIARQVLGEDPSYVFDPVPMTSSQSTCNTHMLLMGAANVITELTGRIIVTRPNSIVISPRSPSKHDTPMMTSSPRGSWRSRDSSPVDAAGQPRVQRSRSLFSAGDVFIGEPSSDAGAVDRRSSSSSIAHAVSRDQRSASYTTVLSEDQCSPSYKTVVSLDQRSASCTTMLSGAQEEPKDQDQPRSPLSRTFQLLQSALPRMGRSLSPSPRKRAHTSDDALDGGLGSVANDNNDDKTSAAPKRSSAPVSPVKTLSSPQLVLTTSKPELPRIHYRCPSQEDTSPAGGPQLNTQIKYSFRDSTTPAANTTTGRTNAQQSPPSNSVNNNFSFGDRTANTLASLPTGSRTATVMPPPGENNYKFRDRTATFTATGAKTSRTGIQPPPNSFVSASEPGARKSSLQVRRAPGSRSSSLTPETRITGRYNAYRYDSDEDSAANAYCDMLHFKASPSLSMSASSSSSSDSGSPSPPFALHRRTTHREHCKQPPQQDHRSRRTVPGHKEPLFTISQPVETPGNRRSRSSSPKSRQRCYTSAAAAAAKPCSGAWPNPTVSEAIEQYWRPRSYTNSATQAPYQGSLGNMDAAAISALIKNKLT